MLLYADLFGHYKPDPQVYLGACRLLDLPSQEVILCVAHNCDLEVAHALGLKTAFIARPLEYGPGRTQDLAAEQDWDLTTSDLPDLHRQLATLTQPTSSFLPPEPLVQPARHDAPGKARAAPARVRQELCHVREGYPGPPDRQARSCPTDRNPR